MRGRKPGFAGGSIGILEPEPKIFGVQPIGQESNCSLSGRGEDMASTSGGPFSATVVGLNGVADVLLLGELDIDTASELRAVLDPLVENGPGEIVLDCNGLSFIDSSGIAALISAQKRLGSKGRRLVLRSPRPMIVKVLEVTDLIDFLNVETNERID